MMKYWPTFVEINISNVKHNVREIKKRIGDDVCLMAVIKADAYGHGEYEVSAAALQSGAEKLGVASVDDGIYLREKGITAPILILGLSFAEAVSDIVKYELMQTVCDENLAREISNEAARQNKTAAINVKVNTGMNRIGVEPEDAVSLVEKIKKYPNLYLEGIYTHLAASYGERDYTNLQYGKFKAILDGLEEKGIPIPFKHCCNTGGVLNFPDMYLNQVRVGAIITTPYKAIDEIMNLDLKECLEFKSKIVFVRKLKSGQSIGYNRMFYADSDRDVAVVSAGWGDGIPRELSNKGSVLIHGIKCPILGRICCDQLFADVTGIKNVQPGDEVVMIGKQGDACLSAWEWSEILGGVSSSLTFRSFITQRVTRKFAE